MGPVLLDVTIKGVKTFKNKTFKFNFLTERRGFKSEIEDSVISPLSGSNYRNHVLAITGINASGKTTTLNLLYFILQVYLMGESLNSFMFMSFSDAKEISELFDDNVEVSFHVQKEKTLYFVRSAFERDKASQQFFFSEEKIISKELNSRETQKNFLHFDSPNTADQLKRSELSADMRLFLKPDDSIVYACLGIDKSCREKYYVQSTIDRTNINIFPRIQSNDLLPLILSYLDPSIESFESVKPELDTASKVPRYRIKFHGAEPLTIPRNELEIYLSSGTLRGLDLYGRIAQVMHCGGYLLVDETENHFNKVLVENIIDLFQSPINQKGASLIFSTHYSELLDTVKRMDGIKVLRKSTEGIELDSLSALAKTRGKDRSDVKNSDLILSGIFKTAPPYKEFWELQKGISDFVIRGGQES